MSKKRTPYGKRAPEPGLPKFFFFLLSLINGFSPVFKVPKKNFSQFQNFQRKGQLPPTHNRGLN